ncbi:hypothetical protein [Bacillus sp. 165]|nr:hypothetical protein [Bacillus sp. 165]MBO9128606.1 hypothetical protein [Bacillus sp. 165]
MKRTRIGYFSLNASSAKGSERMKKLTKMVVTIIQEGLLVYNYCYAA